MNRKIYQIPKTLADDLIAEKELDVRTVDIGGVTMVCYPTSLPGNVHILRTAQNKIMTIIQGEKPPERQLQCARVDFDLRCLERELERVQVAPKAEVSAIDRLCLAWVERPYPRCNMQEFLEQAYQDAGIFMTERSFKQALRDAGRRGILKKQGRNWTKA
ncbi:MAG: hypothetical protein HPY45_01880 [Anaerolineae bacterium]|nr:hypothetical protein [Anaerolineae bacterium]